MTAGGPQNTDWKSRAALFLTSQSITLFGSALTQFAIIWYVTVLTSSGAWVAALTVAAYVPQFAVSFFAGVWADRYSRKKLIMLSDGAIAAATLLLALLLPRLDAGTPVLVALVVISALRSVGTGIQTPAVNAAIPQLVPEDRLMKFNGVNSTVQSLVQFAAPAAAGAVLSFSSLRFALLIDIATAAAGMAVLSAVAIPFVKIAQTTCMLSELRSGVRYVLTDGFIKRLLLVFGLFIFLCVPAGFLATLFVNRYYGDTYWYMTMVEVVGFIGMTAGGVLIGAWGGFKNRMKTLTVGMTAFGALAIGMGAIDGFVLYLVLMAVYGVALTMVQTASTALMQENVVPDMMGRVFGLFGAMYAGFLPLGMAVFGPLADVISMRLLMVLSGVALLVMAGAILLDREFYLHGAAKKPEQEV